MTALTGSISATLPEPAATGYLLDSGAVVMDGDALVPDLSPADVTALRGPRPALRRVGRDTVCGGRIDSAQVRLHVYGPLPAEVSPLDLVARLETEIAEAKAKRADTPHDATLILDALAATADTKRNRKLSHFLEELADSGYARDVFAVSRGGKRLVATDPRQNAIWDELRLWLGTHWGEDHSDQPLDLTLMAEKIGAKRLDVIWPGDVGQGGAGTKATDGIVLVLSDATESARATAARHMGVITNLALRRTRSTASWFWPAMALVALGAAVYLALPAPISVTSRAETRAASSQVIAVPVAGFLSDTAVRPGAIVSQGDTLATLRSPDLEAQIAEQRLSVTLSAINAQEALDQGNFAEYQLSERRGEIAAERLRQLETRADWLTLQSPMSGRVVQVIDRDRMGSFLQLGTTVAEVQPEARFTLDITVADADAPWLDAGQDGVVYFGGLRDRAYTIRTLTGPVPRAPDAQPTSAAAGAGATQLGLRAEILDADQSALITGLSGYTRIDTGTAPRIVGVLRPAISYVRLTLWKLFGLNT